MSSETCGWKNVLVVVVVILCVFGLMYAANCLPGLWCTRKQKAGVDIFRFPPGSYPDQAPQGNLLADDKILNIAKSSVASYAHGGVIDPNLINPTLRADYRSPAARPSMSLSGYGYLNDALKPLKAMGYENDTAKKDLTKLSSYGYENDAYALPKSNLSASFSDPSDPATFIENKHIVIPLRQKPQGTDHIRGDVYIEPIKRAWFDTRKTTEDLEKGGHGIIFGSSGGAGYGQMPLQSLGCGCAAGMAPLSGKPPSILSAGSAIIKQYGS